MRLLVWFVGGVISSVTELYKDWVTSGNSAISAKILVLVRNQCYCRLARGNDFLHFHCSNIRCGIWVFLALEVFIGVALELRNDGSTACNWLLIAFGPISDNAGVIAE